MSFGDAYGVFLILMLCSFIGMVVWTYHGKRKHKYDQAANLVFADEVEAPKSAAEVK